MTRKTLFVTLQTAYLLVLPVTTQNLLSARNAITDIINCVMELVHNVIQSANSATVHRE